MPTSTVTHVNVQRFIIAFLAITIVPISGLGIDIYVPSLPAITAYFNANPSAVQLSIAVYLLGYGLFQTVWGTLSDNIGRRPLVILGLCGVLLTSLLIPFSINVSMLLLLRFLQGIAVGPGGIMVRTLLSDTFQGKELEKYSHYLTTAWAVGPIIAPFVGGYLQHYFGWHASFFFLAAYCLILLVIVLKYLPETLVEKIPLSFVKIKSVYREILTDLVFLNAVLLLAFVYTNMVIFNVVGPFLVQTVMGYSAITYGHVALLLGLAWFLGNILNRRLRRYFSVLQITKAAFGLLLIANIILLILTFFALNLPALIVTLMVLLIGSAILFSSFFALCISLFKNNAGMASAVMGTFFITSVSIISAFASLLKTKTLLPLSCAYLIVTLVCFFVYRRRATQQLIAPSV